MGGHVASAEPGNDRGVDALFGQRLGSRGGGEACWPALLFGDDSENALRPWEDSDHENKLCLTWLLFAKAPPCLSCQEGPMKRGKLALKTHPMWWFLVQAARGPRSAPLTRRLRPSPLGRPRHRNASSRAVGPRGAIWPFIALDAATSRPPRPSAPIPVVERCVLLDDASCVLAPAGTALHEQNASGRAAGQHGFEDLAMLGARSVNRSILERAINKTSMPRSFRSTLIWSTTARQSVRAST